MLRRRSQRALATVLFALFSLTAARPAAADPTVSYHITGSYSAPVDSDTRLEESSFLIQTTAGGSNGSQDISPPGSFAIDRIEFFSDPVFAPFDIHYSDVRYFGYFGLVSTYDVDDNRTDARLFVAADPGSISGNAWSTALTDYLIAHPAITTLTQIVQIIDDGPDVPTPGANTDWIDFNNFIADNANATFGGNIQTDFQTGDTLDLIVFDNTTGLGSSFGTIAVEAQHIPEPAAVSLALASLLLICRRRR